MPSATTNRRGILALTAGTACFAVNDVMTKLVARALPMGELLTIRSLLAMVMFTVWLAALGHLRSIPHALNGFVLMRSLFDALASFFFVAAIIHMPIAEITAVVMAAPLFIVALSVMIYGEKVGRRRWTAVLVGFAGTLFIVKPTPAALDVWALLGLLSALCSAGRELLTRRIPAGIPTVVISLVGSTTIMLMGVAVSITETWKPVTFTELGLLAVAAVFFGLAIHFIAVAFRDVEMSVVAPFRYTSLLWGGLAGFIAFRELPDYWSAVGALLIVASGIYVLHREALRRAKAAALRTKTSD